MIFEIKHQEQYSRGELLLRSFFGYFYIVIPHLFLLTFLSIWASIITFIAFWSILFTGRYPQSFFEYQVKLMRWNLRVNARIYNLSDGYPPFGLSAEDDAVTFEMPYPESLSRGLCLVKMLFGYFYVIIPHGIVLYFRMIAMMFLQFIAWWAVLFTGEYPKSWFKNAKLRNLSGMPLFIFALACSEYF